MPKVNLELLVWARHSSRCAEDTVSTADEKFLSLLELVCQGRGEDRLQSQQLDNQIRRMIVKSREEN